MSGSGCLPYWVQDHVHGKTMRLMYAWLERRSRNGYRPGTLCPPAVSSTEVWEVDEMGWAFMAMEEPKQQMLLRYFMRRGEDWKEFKGKERISRGKLNRLLLELQDLARARGLLEEEDQQLIRGRKP